MSKNKTATQVPSDAAASPVQQIAIDGTSYNLADLTDTARQHLVNVRLVDQELARLQRQRAIATVARTAYAGAVSAALPKEPTAPADGARMFDAGATLLQLYTGFIYEGPALVRGLQELRRTA